MRATNRLKTQTTVTEKDLCVRASRYSVHIHLAETIITIQQASVLRDSAQRSSQTEVSSVLTVRVTTADSRAAISSVRAISRSSAADIVRVITAMPTATISPARTSMASVRARPTARTTIRAWTAAISPASRLAIVRVTTTEEARAAISPVRTLISAVAISVADMVRSVSRHISSAAVTVSVHLIMILTQSTARRSV